MQRISMLITLDQSFYNFPIQTELFPATPVLCWHKHNYWWQEDDQWYNRDINITFTLQMAGCNGGNIFRFQANKLNYDYEAFIGKSWLTKWTDIMVCNKPAIATQCAPYLCRYLARPGKSATKKMNLLFVVYWSCFSLTFFAFVKKLLVQFEFWCVSFKHILHQKTFCSKH